MVAQGAASNNSDDSESYSERDGNVDGPQPQSCIVPDQFLYPELMLTLTAACIVHSRAET